MNGNFSELERLTAAVADFCAANSLDDDAGFHLNLVLEELFVNAVRHGGCQGVPDSARVRLWQAADGVEVEFRDRGHPFDPTSVPDVDIHASLVERHDGGLGIHLVRQIMRDVHYERDGEWNLLRMRRPAAQPDPGENRKGQ